ncbi:hypothetical protein CL689_02380 [Candidatus Saccharibacteria bacterium]|nr:hypothetical protein [Candidatus Saccharibacteria bacterium]
MALQIKNKEFYSSDNLATARTTLDGLTDQVNEWLKDNIPGNIVNVETVYGNMRHQATQYPGHKETVGGLRVWYLSHD